MTFRLRSSTICVAVLAGLCFAGLIATVAADEDFYKVLGLPKDCNERQIKKACLFQPSFQRPSEESCLFSDRLFPFVLLAQAYHKLSAKWHPDKAKNEEDKKVYHEKFLVISRGMFFSQGASPSLDLCNAVTRHQTSAFSNLTLLASLFPSLNSHLSFCFFTSQLIKFSPILRRGVSMI